MSLLQYILGAAYIVIVLSYLFALLSNKWLFALMIYVFAIPLKHIYMTIGGHYLELWKLLSLLSLPLTLISIHRIYHKFLLINILIYYFILALVSSFLGILISNIVHGVPSLGIDLQRILTQSLQLLAFMNMVILPAMLLRNNTILIDKVIKTYIGTMIVLALLGILQYLIFVYSGTNILPIPRMSGEFEEEVFINYLNDERVDAIFRVTSLSMEPKNLALYLVTAIVFLVELKRALGKAVFGKFVDIISLLLMFVCLIMTYSTLGFAALALYLVVVFLDIKRNFSYILVLIMLSPFLFVDFGLQISDIIEARLFQRVNSSGFMEDFDLATWSFLVNNPAFILTGVGYGNIHLVANEYLPAFAEWASGGRWHAKMGCLYVLGSTGAIGLLFFGAIFLVSLLYVKRLIRVPIGRFTQNTLLTFSLIYFFRQTEIWFLVIGLAFAVYVCHRIEFKK